MFGTRNDRFRVVFLRETAVFLTIFGLFFACALISVKAQAITEGFDNVANLPASGWAQSNKSSPVGASTWSQCGGTAIPPAQSGASTSCILVNFNSTTGVGTISNWLFAPTRTFNNGDTISFYTKTPSNNFPDRLQLRLSLNGASTNVGTTATDVGDFTTLLLDINPTYSGTYPTTWTQFTATISGLSAPTSGRVAFRYFVENGGPDGTRSNIIGVDTFAYTPFTPPASQQHVLDFNGDGKTDFGVTRNVGGQLRWFYNTNGTGAATVALDWGLSTDVTVPEDYDGDNKTDIAVWRGDIPFNSYFYILQSQSNTVRTVAFGQAGDNPAVVGDYDGDGKADPAVYRSGASAGAQSTWYYLGSNNNPSNNITYVSWGVNGDLPAPGDFDGDGKNDFAIRRTENSNARFWILGTTAGVSTRLFGYMTDIYVPGDYDADGKTDLAVVRSDFGAQTFDWYYQSSSNSAVTQRRFGGLTADIPAQGDYDGDGKTDIAIWRGGTYWILNSGNSAVQNFQLGSTGDTPATRYSYFLGF